MILLENNTNEHNNEHIESILHEVHSSEKINKFRTKGILVYENEFTLTDAEAYDGLKNSGMIKTTGIRSVVYTVLLLLAMAGFIFSYAVKGNFNDIVFTFISAAVLVIVWTVPLISLKKLAKANANGNSIKFRLYEDCLHILCNDNSWLIELDNSNKIRISKNVIIIKRLKDNQLFVIPLRAVADRSKERVLGILRKGMMDL